MDYTKIVKVLSLAATGNSIDAALDEMSKKELECLLELCEEEKARRMLSSGKYSDSEISEITGLSVEQIQALKNSAK